MREIKFRAWDLDNDEMVNIGSLLAILSSPSLPKRILEAANFMQYTGLKDKNGKEIYEGDIYRTSMTKADVVKWSRAGFNPLENEEYIEVIGNIYENPALLTGAKGDENE